MNEKMTFSELSECLSRGEEIEFWYNNLEYWFINGFNEKDWSYWYFLCNEIGLEERICLFHEKHILLKFLETYIIWDKTIKQIFEEWLNY